MACCNFLSFPGFIHPSLPRHLPEPYIVRSEPLQKIVSCICSVTPKPHEYCTALTLTGAGGFGKTTLALALCHHLEIVNKFTNGFLFIPLGPKATDSVTILNEQYCIMTRQNLQHGPYNDVESKIKNLTKVYKDILVIIDDVWDADDAIPIVKAFVNCTIILTTRLPGIRIRTEKVIDIGPMTLKEAVDVMIKGVIGCSGILEGDVILLNKLAESAFKWPLLLSLLRGQINHYVSHVNLSCHEAIEKVCSRLTEHGLTAFDQNDIEQTNRNRQTSIQACIQLSLKFLKESSLNQFKSMILYTGIGGCSLRSILHCLWTISEEEAKQTVEELVDYGLICTYKNMIPPYFYNAEIYVEVHDVISHYCISSLNSKEVVDLSPFLSPLCKEKLVSEEAMRVFKNCYKMNKLDSLPPVQYLQYNKEKLQHVILPYYLNDINMHAFHDPHLVTMMLKKIQTMLVNSVEILVMFNMRLNDLLLGCEKAVRNAHMLSRKCNKRFQECLRTRNFDSLIPTINKYYETEFIKSLATDCVTTVREIAMYCDIILQTDLLEKCKQLQNLTHEYHPITIEKLPRLKLYTKLHKDITTCLDGNSSTPDIMRIYIHISSGEFNEMVEIVYRKYVTKIQEINLQFASEHDPDRKPSN